MNVSPAGLASTSLSAAAAAVSPNMCLPPPRTVGNTMKRYSSTRPSSASARTSCTLPFTRMSPSNSCFSLATAPGRSSAITLVLFHAGSCSVVETTYFGMPLNLSANSPVREGQASAKPSYVARPSSRASLAITSSSLNLFPSSPRSNWNAQPPRSQSSEPPGSSTTPSTEMNCETTTLPMATLPSDWRAAAIDAPVRSNSSRPRDERPEGSEMVLTRTVGERRRPGAVGPQVEVVLEREPDPAVQLVRDERGLDVRVAGRHLGDGHGGLRPPDGVVATAIHGAAPHGPPGRQAGRIDAGRQVGDVMLHRLEAADRAAELAAITDVADRHVQHGAGAADHFHALQGGRDAADALHGRPGVREPRREDPVRRHPHGLERHLVLGVVGERAHPGPAHSRCAGRHHHQPHAAGARRHRVAGHDHEVVGDAGVGNEQLRAVHTTTASPSSTDVVASASAEARTP